MKQLSWVAILAALCTVCTACAAAPAAQAPAPLPTARIALAPTSSQAPAPKLPTLSPTTSAPASPAPASPAPTSLPTAAPTALAEQAATPASNESAALEQQLIDAINQARAAQGLPAYQASAELSAAARAHSCDLAQHQLISHVSSDGRTLADRLAGATPAWQWPSENIAAGLADPAAVVALWLDEPADGWHRRNILDPDQQAVGAGYCHQPDDPSGNQHYWTADFARRS